MSGKQNQDRPLRQRPKKMRSKTKVASVDVRELIFKDLASSVPVYVIISPELGTEIKSSELELSPPKPMTAEQGKKAIKALEAAGFVTRTKSNCAVVELNTGKKGKKWADTEPAADANADSLVNLRKKNVEIRGAELRRPEDEGQVRTAPNSDLLITALRARGVSDRVCEMVASELTAHKGSRSQAKIGSDVAGTAEPIHPGVLIKEFLEQLNLTVAEAAEKLGITRQQLYRVFNGYSDISPELALKLETQFGIPADEWLRLQAAFDLTQLRSQQKRPAKTRATPVTAKLT